LPISSRGAEAGFAVAVVAWPHFNGIMVPELVDHWWVNARIATLDRSVPAPYGLRDGWSLGVRDGLIAAILPPGSNPVPGAPSTNCEGRFITPALIDCHTHLVHGGSRAKEWEMRLAGTAYAEIANRGGGILSTVRATRAMTEDELVRSAEPRLRALIKEGVTCVEIKSGYGLTLDDELKMLRAARRLGEELSIEVSPTLLAAHAVSPEFAGHVDGYVELIVKEIIPAAADKKLAEAVDVFCESIAFDPAQCDRILTAATEHGLAVKGHVEQLSNSHGAEVVARHGGWSADHLEYLDAAGIRAMKQAGTVAVLLPGAYYFLREKQAPPVEHLRAAGVPIAVATDLNPGTSPFASLRLAMNLTCVLFGLTPEEALAGATREAARALGRGNRLGTLETGKDATFLIWDVEHPAEIVLQLGVNPLRERVIRGRSCPLPT
jgi:imidazolonepropionase